MTLYQTKPTSPEDILHYGVKGMRWGIRKDRTSDAVAKEKKKTPQLSDKQKKIVKSTGKVAVGLGIAATTYILGQKSGIKLSDTKSTAKINAGREMITKTLLSEASYKPDKLYSLTPSEVSYIDYVIKDIFKNRV